MDGSQLGRGLKSRELEKWRARVSYLKSTDCQDPYAKAGVLNLLYCDILIKFLVLW